MHTAACTDTHMRGEGNAMLSRGIEGEQPGNYKINSTITIMRCNSDDLDCIMRTFLFQTSAK